MKKYLTSLVIAFLSFLGVIFAYFLLSLLIATAVTAQNCASPTPEYTVALPLTKNYWEYNLQPYNVVKFKGAGKTGDICIKYRQVVIIEGNIELDGNQNIVFNNTYLDGNIKISRQSHIFGGDTLYIMSGTVHLTKFEYWNGLSTIYLSEAATLYINGVKANIGDLYKKCDNAHRLQILKGCGSIMPLVENSLRVLDLGDSWEVSFSFIDKPVKFKLRITDSKRQNRFIVLNPAEAIMQGNKYFFIIKK